MRTLPAHYVDLVPFRGDTERRNTILNMGVKVGDRIELDLEQVNAVDSDAAEILKSYDLKVGEFFDAYAAGEEAGVCVITSRTLDVYSKIDRKGEKVFLKEQIIELEKINSIGKLLADAFAAKPDFSALEAMGVNCEVEGNILTLILDMPDKQEWPEALGGGSLRSEIGRELKLKVSLAPSHDRKNQRLLEVSVKVNEIWPMM